MVSPPARVIWLSTIFIVAGSDTPNNEQREISRSSAFYQRIVENPL
jgi:hypothetical protein